jgi:hypothetical protein
LLTNQYSCINPRKSKLFSKFKINSNVPLSENKIIVVANKVSIF